MSRLAEYSRIMQLQNTKLKIPRIALEVVIKAFEDELKINPEAWGVLTTKITNYPDLILTVAPGLEHNKIALETGVIDSKLIIKMARESGGILMAKNYKKILRQICRKNAKSFCLLPVLFLSAPVFQQDKYKCPEDYEFLLGSIDLSSQHIARR